jgi:hypothetical protein
MFAGFLGQIHDSEFDQAVFDVMNEASELYLDRFQMVGESGNGGATAGEGSWAAERMLEAFVEPLAERTEGMVYGMADAMADRDVAAMTEAELEAELDRFAPSAGGQVSPAFEFFLKKVFSKVKSAVSGAVNLAKKGIGAVAQLGLGPVLKKLGALVRPMLRRVLQVAMDKLPPAVRPIAQTLAKKVLGGAAEAETDAAPGYESYPGDGEFPASEALMLEGPTYEWGGESPASPPPADIQRELDVQIASLVSAEHEGELDLTAAEYEADVERFAAAPDLAGELEAARGRFVDQLRQMERGQDPAPVLEQFLPAILPVAKVAIRLIGRPKVVKFLAKLLARLIQRFVGPQGAAALSQAVVDAGLRLLSLEAEAGGSVATVQEADAGPRALAGTIEETVERLAAVPDYVLENQALLEVEALEAFEQAAAAHFPPSMLKPDRRESAKYGGVWVPRPTARRPYYRKYSTVPQVTITPQMARSVMGFADVRLANFLRDQLGLSPDKNVVARVHLFEGVPGRTWLSRISKYEKAVPGLGSAARSAWTQIHPLTPEAAAVLLGEPRLGRKMGKRFLASRHMISRRGRFYFLQIAGARPQTAPPAPGGSATGRPRGSSQVYLTLDFASKPPVIRVCVFLSEAESQELAAKLRQGASGAAALKGVLAVARTGVRTALSGDLNRRVKIVHETVAPDRFLGLGPVVKKLLPVALEWLAGKILDGVAQRLAEFFQQRSAEFVKATEDPSDGVTLVVEFIDPPGMSVLRDLIKGQVGVLAGGWPPPGVTGLPAANIRIVPGLHRD